MKRDTQQESTKSIIQRTPMNLATAGIVGGLVGTTLGILGVLALRYKKTEGMVGDVVEIVADSTSSLIDTVRKDATEELQQVAKDTFEDVKKALASKAKRALTK